MKRNLNRRIESDREREKIGWIGLVASHQIIPPVGAQESSFRLMEYRCSSLSLFSNHTMLRLLLHPGIQQKVFLSLYQDW